MKKKIGLIFIIFIMIFSLGGCFSKEESDALKFKEDYESLNGEESKSGKIYPEVTIAEDNIIEYVSLEDVSDMIKNESGVFYFGYPTCPWCRNAVPVLLEAASSTDLDKIYYVDMYEKRDTMEINDEGEITTTKEADKGYSELLSVLDSILLDYTLKDKEGNEVQTGEKRVYVPIVVFVVDGEIVDYHMDTVSSQEDPYVVLDDTQKEELYQIYSNGIHKVLGDVCDEGEHC